MFDCDADVFVNTVNCVGVMGKGIALEFKNKYPVMFEEYKQSCDQGKVVPGKIHVYKNIFGDWIINFPTKRHWRDGSRYEDIKSGLVALHDYILAQGKITVAMPALGCSNGGLDWDVVSKLIDDHLKDLEALIYVFEPH